MSAAQLDSTMSVICGDALTVRRSLPAGTAQICVTSPPYWSLRDYGTRSWIGGDDACDHERHAVEDRARVDARLERAAARPRRA